MKARLWLSTAHKFLTRVERRSDHAFLVQLGGATSPDDAWPNEVVLQERFDFDEDVEQDWSEMEIPSEHREHVTATISPEV